MVTKFMVVMSLVFLTSCYVEEVDRRSQHATKRETGVGGSFELAKEKGKCHLTRKTGCFRGHVAAAMDLVVDGRTFFDAEDLANRFHEVVQIEDKKGRSLEQGVDFSIELLTPFDNKSFARDFSVYVKGPKTDAVAVRGQGKFFVNKMPAGEYQLRVQRPVRFSVIRLDSDSEQEELEPPKARVYCATLYQDRFVEVYENERAASEVFDDFQLYVTDVACTDQRIDRVINP